ncbi:PKD domain-containing protein [Yeosuana sp. MJ-SS3]|uniref:PKD domain-containing protein n=1 Tax=Gilvirhabdus luticola TaxID=3079858 RepID=A0ABU3U5I7_9FLAO|nr:PKD domain-containing protein [Yeosuana sp. MJ-SS3]MDU8885663.1 PKD domain-containing protein [Yeosuana sp. MJ-SS3]
MKTFKYLLSCSIVILAFINCSDDDANFDYLKSVAPPTNVTAVFQVTQDNTGIVTITPNSDGATKYMVYLGDDTSEPVEVIQGRNIIHTYAEGTYSVKIEAIGITGLISEITKELVVSFNAPENLDVVIENDAAVSKQVNVTVNADFAISYDVYFGELGNDTPVTTNVGETVSYVYQDPGTYTIRIVVMGAAIETTEYTEEFEVTAILQPLASAPQQPSRGVGDVISLYSERYDDLPGTDFFPDWGQGGCCGSGWTTFDLNGDEMLQYINLSYQGNQLSAPVDLTAMEYMHIDLWTADVLSRVEISLISVSNGEKPVWVDLTPNGWTSIDIPISAWTDQGLTVGDIHQLKYVGDPFSGGGTVFIDNIYFYKEPSGVITSMVEDFEGTPPTFTVFGNIADTQVVSNPDASGINTSGNVAQLTKTAGSEVWAGTFFETAAPLDLATYNKINVKTWSPKNGAMVKLKLENIDASIVHEQDLFTTSINTWENLLYDFSGAPVADYVRIVIFFDFGNSGDDSVYYYDDIELVNNDGGPPASIFQDFEGTPPTFTVFGNIADTQVIANPDISGINTTANVAQLTKTAGSEVWAGTFFETAAPLDLVTYSKISVKTWSPVNGAMVKLKLENSDASIVHEQDLFTSTTNAWEELTYDFSGAPVADYIRVVIFFDFGNAGDDSIYYFDEYTLTN